MIFRRSLRACAARATSGAVKAEEKRQANQRQISKKSASRLPDGLPVKQAIFVDQYVVDFNATNAAKKAGYSEKSARKIANELLDKTGQNWTKPAFK